jgi:photosystem II stability/assembly factor-like uncharacterized protein
MNYALISTLLLLLFSQTASAQLWTQLGPNGGYFKDFAIDPANPQIVFAGSDDSGGIWKSTDGGITWTHVTNQLPDFSGWHITIDTLTPGTVYACEMYGRYGVAKSTDGGNTWTHIGNGLQTKYDRMATKLVVDPANAQRLWISTGSDENGNPPRPGNGVFVSTNGGASWQPTGLQDTTVPCIAVTPGGVLFAGTAGQGLFTSANAGASWQQVAAIPANAGVQQIEVSGNVVAVATYLGGVFLSTDGGSTFTNIGLLNELNFDISIARITPHIEICCTATLQPQRWSSQTGSWTVLTAAPANLLGIGIAARNNEIFYGVFSNTLIWHSADGGNTFSQIALSPRCVESNSIVVDPQNQNHWCISLLGTYSASWNQPCLSETFDAGLTWTRKGPDAHGLCVRFVPGAPQIMYAGTFGQGLFKSNDGFTTWTQLRSGNKLISDISIDPQDTAKVFIAEVDLTTLQFGLYRSNDGGNTFAPVLTQLVNQLWNSPTSDTLVAATENGIFISPDDGNNWAQLFAGFDITAIAEHNGAIYAGMQTGQIFRALPTYQNISNAIWGTMVCKSLLFKGDTLFAGFSGAEMDTSYTLHGGVWMSTDLGISWSDVTGNLSTTHAYGNPALAVANGYLLISTYTGSVWIFDIITSAPAVAQTEMLPVYPVPAAHELRFTLEQPALVTLYDAAGCRVREMQAHPGTHTMPVYDLPAGLYALRVQAANNVRTSRVVVAH